MEHGWLGFSGWDFTSAGTTLKSTDATLASWAEIGRSIASRETPIAPTANNRVINLPFFVGVSFNLFVPYADQNSESFKTKPKNIAA